MNYSRILICVLIMAIVTYLPRVLPLAVFRKKIENRFIKSFLAYVPYAVLAAMTIPDIFTSTACLISAITGLVVALILAYKNKGLLTVALGAVGTVFVTEMILRLCGVLSW
jgi:branched-subunit amino acid transport protein